ncbi:SH3 domain-containing protein [Vibrio owensii]|uniref:SH3 domain-containing protein n=1 Tax=Vibrio owensii TaxID=696485 RepID=UPI00140554FC|nr:SH3 domain-containing protein [Vibrio owensii]
MDQIQATLNKPWMKQMEQIRSVVNQPWVQNFEYIKSIQQSMITPEMASLTENLNRYNIQNYSTVVDHFPQVELIKHWKTLSLDFPKIPSVLPDEFLVTLNLLKLHRAVFNEIAEEGFIHELSAVEESSEFSEVLSEVNEELKTPNLTKTLLLQVLRKVPVILRILLIGFFQYVMVPLSVTLYLQPRIEAYLNETDEPKRVQTNNIKRLPQQENVEVTSLNRFISGVGVRLRASASIKSDILMSLSYGQAVYVIEKQRSWSKVAVPIKDGNFMEGWVFTEYTERFKN